MGSSQPVSISPISFRFACHNSLSSVCAIVRNGHGGIRTGAAIEGRASDDSEGRRTRPVSGLIRAERHPPEHSERLLTLEDNCFSLICFRSCRPGGFLFAAIFLDSSGASATRVFHYREGSYQILKWAKMLCWAAATEIWIAPHCLGVFYC